MTDVTVRSRLSSWAYALRTTNPPPDGPVDIVTRGSSSPARRCCR